MEFTGAHWAIIVVVVVVVFGMKVYLGANADFEDPKTMPDEKLVGAIAGQADWLERANSLKLQTILREGPGPGLSPSVVAIAQKRRGYVAQLCLECVSRGTVSNGAATPRLAFVQVAELSNDLRSQGTSAQSAAVNAVKKKMFTENGFFYAASWEE